MELTDIEIQLKEKLGEKNFKRAQIISENKFGYKTNLIEKYYKSLLQGYLTIEDEWSSEYIIEMITNKFNMSKDKVSFIQSILDTYDTKDDKTRQILEKYLRAMRNNVI